MKYNKWKHACRCMGVTYEEIVDVLNMGVTDYEILRGMLVTGEFCGLCNETIHRFMREYLGEQGKFLSLPGKNWQGFVTEITDDLLRLEDGSGRCGGYLLLDRYAVLVGVENAPLEAPFFAALTEALEGRALDSVIFTRVGEHSIALAQRLRQQFPELELIADTEACAALEAALGFGLKLRQVGAGQVMHSGVHTLTFFPDANTGAMAVYDMVDRTVFSGFAFGASPMADAAPEAAAAYYAAQTEAQQANAKALLAQLKYRPVRLLCPLCGPAQKQEHANALLESLRTTLA